MCKNIFIFQNPRYKEYIEWSPTGLFFTIKDINDFEKKILNEEFKHKNFSTFRR